MGSPSSGSRPPGRPPRCPTGTSPCASRPGRTGPAARRPRPGPTWCSSSPTTSAGTPCGRCRTCSRSWCDHGVTFDNAFAVNPTCCPSRAAILRGEYSHGTGVYKNTPPFGGFDTFDDSSTVATWLHDAGYRTGMIGKYLNGYKTTEYVPPGWDAWEAFLTDNGNGDYFDYDLSVNGSKVHFGSDGPATTPPTCWPPTRCRSSTRRPRARPCSCTSARRHRTSPRPLPRDTPTRSTTCRPGALPATTRPTPTTSPPT